MLHVNRYSRIFIGFFLLLIIGLGNIAAAERSLNKAMIPAVGDTKKAGLKKIANQRRLIAAIVAGDQKEIRATLIDAEVPFKEVGQSVETGDRQPVNGVPKSNIKSTEGLSKILAKKIMFLEAA